MEMLGDALGTKLIDSKTLEIIQERIKHLMDNPPTMICVNVVLNDQSALRHMICREIIMNTSGISENDADWYILRAGAERELEKLSTVGVVEKTNEV